jgi:hypothetical protein
VFLVPSIGENAMQLLLLIVGLVSFTPRAAASSISVFM